MDTTNTPSPPAEKPKRSRGRQRVEVARTPLYVLPGTKEEQLTEVYQRWHTCTRCFLGEHRKASGLPDDIVFGDGNPEADILIVGEAPGAEEEKDFIPFIGAAGKLLDQVIACTADSPEVQELFEWYSKTPHTKQNDKKFHDTVLEYRRSRFFITNVVVCRPPDNRTPVKAEMDACWERLWNTIYTVDPILIIAAGATALSTIMRRVSVSIMDKQGQLQEVTYDGHFGKVVYPVMPILHPSYLLRVADWKSKDGAFAKTVKHFRAAMEAADFYRLEHYGTPLPKRT